MRLPLRFVLVGAVLGVAGACGLSDYSGSACSAICGDGTVCDQASGMCVIAPVGTGGTGGSSNGDQGSGLPCAVTNLLASKCTSCHGATLSGGAPYPLVTRDDLVKPSPSYSGQTVAQRCLARMQNSQSPMPPAYAGTLPGTADIAAFQQWINSGMPAGTCGGTGGGTGSTGGGAGGGVVSTGGGTATGGGAGGGHAGGSGGGTGAGGGGGGTTTVYPCANHSYQCVDATGAGDYVCIDPTTASGFPANAPTCTSSASCGTNAGCWLASSTATTGQCLSNCVPGTGAGGSGGGGGGGGGTAGGAGGGGGSTTCTTDTWSSYGSSFFSSTCMSGCHQHTGEFTSHATVQSRASELISRIQYNMPPNGITAAQQARIVKYLNCGAP